LFKVQFVLSAFKGERSLPRSQSNLSVLLNALYTINCQWLRTHPRTPRLYSSGVFYRAEPIGQENWQDIPTTLKLGFGDCEDLACWRAAELTVRDKIPARPVYRWRRRPGLTIYHIVVRLADGRIDDPSKRLGMGSLEDAKIRVLQEMEPDA
jgi:hypothetical protein